MDSNGIARHPKTRAGSAAVPAASGIPSRPLSVAPETDREWERGHPGRPGRHRAPSTWLSLLTGAVLLLGTGCSLLDPLTGGSSDTPVHSVDPNVPFVVVTVGGVAGRDPDPQRRRDDPGLDAAPEDGPADPRSGSRPPLSRAERQQPRVGGSAGRPACCESPRPLSEYAP